MITKDIVPEAGRWYRDVPWFLYYGMCAHLPIRHAFHADVLSELLKDTEDDNVINDYEFATGV